MSKPITFISLIEEGTMSTKIFLVTSQELAEHSQKSKDLIFEMFTVAHSTYPELTVPQIIEYTQNWAASVAESEEEWDYVPGLLDAMANDLAADEEPETEPEEEIVLVLDEDDYVADDYNLDVTDEVATADDEEQEDVPLLLEAPEEQEEFTPEDDYDTPFEVDAEPALAADNVATFNVGGYTVVQQVEEEEAEEEEEDDATADFYNQDAPAVISRQKRYKGLLSEAGKLDRF